MISSVFTLTISIPRQRKLIRAAAGLAPAALGPRLRADEAARGLTSAALTFPISAEPGDGRGVVAAFATFSPAFLAAVGAAAQPRKWGLNAAPILSIR